MAEDVWEWMMRQHLHPILQMDRIFAGIGTRLPGFSGKHLRQSSTNGCINTDLTSKDPHNNYGSFKIRGKRTFYLQKTWYRNINVGKLNCWLCSFQKGVYMNPYCQRENSGKNFLEKARISFAILHKGMCKILPSSTPLPPPTAGGKKIKCGINTSYSGQQPAGSP